MTQRLGPIHCVQLWREIERLRRADQILLRRVWREHRTHLVLLAVEPRDEQHLDRAAAIPVSLLKVRSNSPDACAKALRDERRVSRIALGRNRKLPFSGRRAAN